MVDFALIGAAGFVAPRHLEAIHAVGGRLVAAMDPSDSVGILDRYFPEAEFFTEPERFDRFLEKRRREGRGVDYVSICSPNHLHDAHVRQALRVRAHAICEKPLVISPWNLDALAQLEKEYDRRVYTVLQLRHHPEVIALKKRFESYSGPPVPVELTYITPRGAWYHVSWKGDPERSGGLLMNIGIHFIDLLLWVFGGVRGQEVVSRDACTIRGNLDLEKARVCFHLSVERRLEGALRIIRVDGQPIEFLLEGAALHLETYRDIVRGAGLGIVDARAAISLGYRLERAQVDPTKPIR